MRLRDSINVVDADSGTVTTVPAHVYYVSTADEAPDGLTGITALVNTLRAIVRSMPDDFDPLTDGIIWQGRTYELLGSAMPRMRNGTTHHYTLTLTERVQET